MGCLNSRIFKTPVQSRVALDGTPTAQRQDMLCMMARSETHDPWLLITNMNVDNSRSRRKFDRVSCAHLPSRMIAQGDSLDELSEVDLSNDTCSVSVKHLGRLLGGTLGVADVHSVRVEYRRGGARGAFVSRNHALIAAVCGDDSALKAWSPDTDTTLTAAGHVPDDLHWWYPPEHKPAHWRAANEVMKLRVWVRMHECVLDLAGATPRPLDDDEATPSPSRPPVKSLTSTTLAMVDTPSVTISTVEALSTDADLPALLQRFYIAQQGRNQRCVRCNGAGTITTKVCSKRTATRKSSTTSTSSRPASPVSHRSAVTVASAASQAHNNSSSAEHVHSHSGSHMVTVKGPCTMCNGSGSITPLMNMLNGMHGDEVGTKREEGAEVAIADDDDDDVPMCGMCMTDAAKLRMSSTCQHRFCAGCIKEFLSSELAKGSSNIRCPTCADGGGGESPADGVAEHKGSDTAAEEGESETKHNNGESAGTKGHVDAAALSFLAFVGVIGQTLYHRILRQQGELSGITFFTCPNKGCDCALVEPAGVKPGADGKYPCRTCPGCSSMVCIGCHQVTPASGDHRCMMDVLARREKEHAKVMETLNTMRSRNVAKQCPKCKQWINKNGGCSSMMCGTRAHGSLRDAIRNGGCGYMFHWATLAAKPGGFKDLNGQSRSGQPPDMYKDEIRRLRAELGFQPFPWEVESR